MLTVPLGTKGTAHHVVPQEETRLGQEANAGVKGGPRPGLIGLSAGKAR